MMNYLQEKLAISASPKIYIILDCYLPTLNSENRSLFRLLRNKLSSKFTIYFTDETLAKGQEIYKELGKHTYTQTKPLYYETIW
jgi:hypothetical protein